MTSPLMTARSPPPMASSRVHTKTTTATGEGQFGIIVDSCFISQSWSEFHDQNVLYTLNEN